MKTEHLKYFVGKVCSIFTTPHSRDLYRENPKDLSVVFRYFVGEVLAADEEGIMLRKVSKDIRTFISREHIVAVAEEEVLDPKKPQDAKAIQEMLDARNKQLETQRQTVSTSGAFTAPTVNAENLAKLAQEVKSKFGPASST